MDQAALSPSPLAGVLTEPAPADSHTLQSTPDCPRCGYDLSGVMASWKDQWPLTDICSECGLAFDWGDLLSQHRNGPRWSFEHGPRWSIRRFARSFLRVLSPQGPWRTLRLELAIVPRRLIWFPAIAAGLIHLTFGLSTAFERLWDLPGPSTGSWITDFLLYMLPMVVWPYSTNDLAMGRGFMPMFAAWFVLLWAFVPLLMMVLGETFRRTKVKRVHLLRGAAYSSAFMTALLVVCFLAMWVLTFIGGIEFTQGLPAFLQMLAVGVVPPLLLGFWWHAFIRNYLRLPRAGAIAGLLVPVSLLATVTCLVVVTLFLG